MCEGDEMGVIFVSMSVVVEVRTATNDDLFGTNQDYGIISGMIERCVVNGARKCSFLTPYRILPGTCIVHDAPHASIIV